MIYFTSPVLPDPTASRSSDVSFVWFIAMTNFFFFFVVVKPLPKFVLSEIGKFITLLGEKRGGGGPTFSGL